MIHTVGPIWQGDTHQEAEILSRCYRNAMALAEQHQLRTLAFPAISCGIYGFPIPQACHIALTTLRQQLSNTQIERVIFACLDPGCLKHSIKSLKPVK
nr:macro domain-containing protein [Dongshaea marina]